MVADAFGAEERSLARRVVVKTVSNPLAPVIYVPLAYALMEVEKKLEKKIGQKATLRLFSRPAYLGLKVGTRAIPVLGWTLLAHDVYSLADAQFADGRWPLGAKRRD